MLSAQGTQCFIYFKNSFIMTPQGVCAAGEKWVGVGEEIHHFTLNLSVMEQIKSSYAK